MSLNNDSCISRPPFIDLNPAEINFYPFMINLDERNGSGNVVNDLSVTMCAPNSTKDVNVKVFNLIKIYEGKALVEDSSCECNWKLDSTIYSSNKKWYND